MPAQSLPVAHALGFLSVFLYYPGGGAQLTHREWGGCQGVLLSGGRGLLMTGGGILHKESSALSLQTGSPEEYSLTASRSFFCRI